MTAQPDPLLVADIDLTSNDIILRPRQSGQDIGLLTGWEAIWQRLSFALADAVASAVQGPQTPAIVSAASSAVSAACLRDPAISAVPNVQLLPDTTGTRASLGVAVTVVVGTQQTTLSFTFGATGAVLTP